MQRKLPAMMFYPGDWMKDPAVRAASLTSRGLWIELLCLMHESNKRGYLAHKNGKPMTVPQIARVVGVALDECKTLVEELIEIGACSVDDDGVIYSRRMVRDEAERSKRSVTGKRGGRIRVANEREARRDANDSRTNHGKDPAVVKVWDSIDGGKQKNKAPTLKAISDAIDRLIADKKHKTRVDASVWLGERVSEYYSSPEGAGKYWRKPSRFLDEDGFDEPTESWAGRVNTEAF